MDLRIEEDVDDEESSTKSQDQVRIKISQLVAMMLDGQNNLVMQYLRTLPKDECSRERTSLIKHLEAYQKKYKRNPNPGVPTPPNPNRSQGTNNKRSKSKNELEEAKANAARRKIKVRKRIHSSPPTDCTTNSNNEPPLHSPKMIGKYELDVELGKGMFGVVYRAMDTEKGRVVAVKCIEKDAVEPAKLPLVMREAELLKKLDHPNIVKIFDVIQTKKKIAFVLEYIDKGSLYVILKKQATIPEHLVALFTNQTLLALKYLHGQGVIHRDIKAGNILINGEGVIKLADFGTAKPEDQNKNFTVIGTPYWMAPEVIEMTGGGTKSDIWSLGCTVIELLTGNPPYFELGTMQALFNIVEDEHPPLPPNLSKELEHFLMCCLTKDTKRRPAAEPLLGHPWLEKSKEVEVTSYEEIQNIIKKHNSTKFSSFPDINRIKIDEPTKKDYKKRDTPLVLTEKGSDTDDEPKSPISRPSSTLSTESSPRSRSNSTTSSTSAPITSTTATRSSSVRGTHKRTKSNTRNLGSASPTPLRDKKRSMSLDRDHLIQEIIQVTVQRDALLKEREELLRLLEKARLERDRFKQ